MLKNFAVGVAKAATVGAVTFLASHYADGHLDNPFTSVHGGPLVAAVIAAVVLFIKSPLQK